MSKIDKNSRATLVDKVNFLLITRSFQLNFVTVFLACKRIHNMIDFSEMKVNEKIWKGIDEGLYEQDSEEMNLAWQGAIAEASRESLKERIHKPPLPL